MHAGDRRRRRDAAHVRPGGPDRAQRRDALAAFRPLPAYRRLAREHGWSGAPEVFVFRDLTRPVEVRALVVMESFEPNEDGCGNRHASLRSIVALPPGGKATVIGEGEGGLGDQAVAMFDGAGDGHVEVVVGPRRLDAGMSVFTQLVSIWDSAPAGAVTDVVFESYGGCD